MKFTNTNLLVTNGWVNGQLRKGEKAFSVYNPATNEVIADVSDLTANDALDAIESASDAFKLWRVIPVGKRSDIISKWSQLLLDNHNELASILCLENGKALQEAKNEINQCAGILKWYAELALKDSIIVYPSTSDNQKNYSVMQPIGVVACITPWNFPGAAVMVKAGAAIVTGCSVIIKPSEETPLIALAFARLAKDAGIPDGIFSVLTSSSPGEIGDALCQDKRVKMLSFTGSTKVGKHLYRNCAGTIKRLAFELGGNAPFIVFDDADIELALSCAKNARFYNNGQICVGANRFFIHENIFDQFTERFTAEVKKLTTGNGMDPNTNLGPMINAAAMKRVTDIVANAIDNGATIQVGGKALAGNSNFFAATVLTDMKPSMDAFKGEIFGPVACLYKFAEDNEVLKLANDTDTGLAAYVFTKDQGKIEYFCNELEAGVVGANSSNIFSNDLPFGGIKQSGLGREHGPECLNEFMETKSICLGLKE